jgi:hypothetical protein
MQRTLTTLLKEHRPVADYMVHLRRPKEGAMVKHFLPSYEHGSSPRLSRHAIRRLSDKMETHGVAAVRAHFPAPEEKVSRAASTMKGKLKSLASRLAGEKKSAV